MAAEHIKSTNITGLDATPATKLRGGQGAADGAKIVTASLTVTTGKDTGSTYQLVRVKSTASIKRITLDAAALSASTAFDFGVYYSSANDGTPTALQGTVVDADFFASAVACTNANLAVDITNESGTYTIDKRTKALWDAVGLTADPGGYLDIVATATASTAGTGTMGISVSFTD
jgi:hypothetical protein